MKEMSRACGCGWFACALDVENMLNTQSEGESVFFVLLVWRVVCGFVYLFGLVSAWVQRSPDCSLGFQHSSVRFIFEPGSDSTTPLRPVCHLFLQQACSLPTKPGGRHIVSFQIDRQRHELNRPIRMGNEKKIAFLPKLRGNSIQGAE